MPGSGDHGKVGLGARQVFASPAISAQRNTLPHVQPWRLALTSRLPLTAPLDDPALLTDWLPARVPGCIQRDLMAAGRVPDLYALPDPGAALAEFDTLDFWLCTDLPAISPDQRAWLRFEGIDYFAAVTLGKQELGRGPGMFAAREWEVTNALRAGPKPLGVRIWGGGSFPRWPDSASLRARRRLIRHVQTGIEPFADRLLMLKAPMQFGWDFAPRLLTAGIWDEVTLHVAGRVGILDLYVRADAGPESALTIGMAVDTERAGSARLTARLTPVNFAGDDDQVFAQTVQLVAGRQTIAIRWPGARLRPWCTHDRGFPHLYRLVVRLEDGNGLLDETATTLGARTIGWDAAGRVGRLYLNGERLPLRGVNWVPLDLLPGGEGEAERYRALLGAAVAAGVNAVRVWGGGGREHGVFYDLCDEMGLLVWQELPIACVFFDHLPDDEAFIDLARNETRGIVRRLRHHPSLGLWCGGNEWGPGRHKRLAAALGETVSQQDPTRLWLPASPGPGDSHNWQVWHDFAPPARYAADPAPLLSEFGLAAPPDLATLSDMLAADQLWPPGPGWQARKAEPAKLWHYARPFLPGPPAIVTVAEFVVASQTAQARGLQIGIEAYRLRPDAIGCFVWQWNEPWPAICWSIIPYHGPPKAAYQQIARSFAPLTPLARFQPNGIELWVANDRLDSPGRCTLAARVDGALAWEGKTTPLANGCALAATLPRPPASARRLELRLTAPGVDLVNDYDLACSYLPDPGPSLTERIIEGVKAWLLRW